jgi:hypothetical protein
MEGSFVHDSDSDDSDDAKIVRVTQTSRTLPAVATRPAELTADNNDESNQLTLRQVIAVKQLASKIKHKAKNLAELRRQQVLEQKKLEGELRENRLKELLELPFDHDGTNDALVNELASLKQVHDSEMEALRKYYDLKRDVAIQNHTALYDEKKEQATGGQEFVSGSKNAFSEVLASIDDEREAQKN